MIALTEDDLARAMAGLDAVDELEALMILFAQRYLTVEEASRMGDAVARARLGLEASRKWMGWVRNGRHLYDD